MKTIQETFSYLSIEYKKIESHLEHMANQGWMLTRIESGMLYHKEAVYEPCEKTNIKFCVDFRIENNDEYIETCLQQGWILVTKTKRFHIFKNLDINATPLQSDEELETLLVKDKIYKKDLYFYNVILIFLISCIGFAIFNRSNSTVVPNSLFISYTTGFSFLILYTIFIIYFIKKSYQNRNFVVKNDEPLAKYFKFPYSITFTVLVLINLSDKLIHGKSYFLDILLAIGFIFIVIIQIGVWIKSSYYKRVVYK